jgi:tripartite-type tricarboxylate transporter receptor subunit TctC
MMLRKLLLSVFVAGAAFSQAAGAQSDWPKQPIRIIAPFAPGGNTDVVARVIAQRLQQELGQSVIVENKTGAGGVIAADYVAKSAPDGYTLFMTSTGPQTISPSLMAKIPYDPIKDFAPISNVQSNALVLLVNPSLPVKNVKELIALAKREPGKLNFGSAGIGGTTHLSAEMFKSMAGIDLVHVPFRGGAPATTAAMTGEVQITFANLSDALPQMKTGKLRALGVTSAKRQPQAPEVPTIAEAGLPGYECIVWNGLLAPAGTPAPIVKRVSAAVQKIAREQAFKAKMTEIGSVPIGDTPEQFSAFIGKELTRWTKIVKDSGAKAE